MTTKNPDQLQSPPSPPSLSRSSDLTAIDTALGIGKRIGWSHYEHALKDAYSTLSAPRRNDLIAFAKKCYLTPEAVSQEEMLALYEQVSER